MLRVLTGTNPYMLKQELDSIIRQFKDEYGDLNIEQLDGEEAAYDRIREAVQSMPFLAGKKLVVLWHPSAQKQFQESLEDLLPTIPDTNEVIIIEPKPDKRTAYYKLLKKQKGFKEFAPLDEQGLLRWLKSEAGERGGSISSQAAHVVLSRVGPNQQQLSNELDKLLLYDPEITPEAVSELVEPNPQSTVFELINAAFGGRTKQAIELYQEQRKARVEPQAIMGMVAWQLHILALLKTAGTRSADEIAKAASIHPFVVRKNMPLAQRVTLARLKEIVSQAAILDRDLKSKPIDADEAVQHFILTLNRE